MSIYFSKKLAKTESDARNMAIQYGYLNKMRANAEQFLPVMCGNDGLFANIARNDPNFQNSEIAKAILSANAARTPADAYREFDSVSVLERNKSGEFATLARLMDVAKSINVGKEVYEYRRVSESGIAQSSMSGRLDIIVDHSDVNYGGTVIPVHDTAFGRSWREVESMRSDGYDALIDDAAGADKVLKRKIDDYLFNGNSKLNVKGNVWLGLRNDTSNVLQFTLTVDLADEASTAEAIRGQFKEARDALRITNNLDAEISVGVSREIMSNLERPFSTADGTFGTIYEYILKLRGIKEIYEDSNLTGNEIVMADYSTSGFHSVVGMAISTYALPRIMHNANLDFVKWAALGFVAKTSYSGNKSVLFGN